MKITIQFYENGRQNNGQILGLLFAALPDKHTKNISDGAHTMGNRSLPAIFTADANQITIVCSEGDLSDMV